MFLSKMLPPIFASVERSNEKSECYLYSIDDERIIPLERSECFQDENETAETSMPIRTSGRYVVDGIQQMLTYWNTGFEVIDIDTNAYIPIYEFQSNILKNISKPIPLIISFIQKCIFMRIVREQRRLLLSNMIIEKPAFTLPVHVCEALIKHGIVNNEICAISLQKLSEVRDIAITSCYHIYSADVLNVWLCEHKYCPVCRAIVYGTVSYRYIHS